jgi:HEXXH motif-containing protein
LITSLRVPADAFDQLASGHGDATTMRVLAAGQHSRRMLLIRAILDEARRYPEVEAAAGLRAAVRLLDGLQHAASDAAVEVLSYPLVGAWAERCLRRLRRVAAGGDDLTPPLWVELGHFAAVAAAAAIRAGRPVRISVPVRGGHVALPSLGMAVLASGASYSVATVTGDPSAGYRVEGTRDAVRLPANPATDATGWHGLRRLETPGSVAYFDDLDPYRKEHGLVADGRLDQGGFESWAAMFEDAVALLGQRLPQRLVELSVWPVVIVPLVDSGTGTGANATARDAVGAMALSPPPNAIALAESIIHEHAHSKLGAVLDMLTLQVPDHRRYYSPWRADPRPVSGLLQGAYAFLAVAEAWEVYTAMPPPPVTPALAWYEFARLRDQVIAALDTIAASGTLTDVGRRFVARLRQQAEKLLAVRVPHTIERLAALVNEDHHLTWRLRHLRIDDAGLEALAARWRRGEPRPDRLPATAVPSDRAPSYAEEARHELIRHLVADQRVHGRAADLDLIAGQFAAAASAYRAELIAGADRLELWTGLALARIRTGHAVRAFRESPEIVRALFVRLGGAAEPDELAGWLE